MVLNVAVQLMREADDLKEKITKFKNGTSLLQDQGIWVLQQKLQKMYQKLLVMDLDYALDKKIEQDLWNVGFKQQIEALQLISKDRKNPLRSDAQSMLAWVLQAAAGFYLCLLHQICTTFKLDLPFRRRASLLGNVEGWRGMDGGPAASAARYISQHCLVHLGDIARYRQQMTVAYTFYRQAVRVSAHCGQPYNQLGLVCARRGSKLSALFWHVRALAVRAPFAPAQLNLKRTLDSASAQPSVLREVDVPVLPGITSDKSPTNVQRNRRLDSHTYVDEFIRAVHYIYNMEDLEEAEKLVNTLNTSLLTLVATESLQSMTIIKMSSIIMWLVDWATEQMSVELTALSISEAHAAQLSLTLAAGAMLALLLPTYTAAKPLEQGLPALKVWLEWLLCRPQAMSSSAFVSRPQLWPALAHTLNSLSDLGVRPMDLYDGVPLCEDVELYGFLPLEAAHANLKLSDHGTWDTYGNRIPDFQDKQEDEDQEFRSPTEATQSSLDSDSELAARVRASRLVKIGKKLVEAKPELLAISDSDPVEFSSVCACSEQLSASLSSMNESIEEKKENDYAIPTVISEEDFRERVKRVGILKPEGSLERAREERAALVVEEEPIEQDEESVDDSKSDDKKEPTKKTRMNVAMAAIMRKQEESNKQVKFISPPPTPDSTPDESTTSDEKTKIMQPRVIKSLANLPLGKKTGGILSLKDKSAGYPHLVNAEPEKKPEAEKVNKPPQKKAEAPKWQPQQSYEPRLQAPFLQQNQNYNQNFNMNQGIRLPVVNPKEIDVRSAMQRQNSRQDMLPDNQHFGYPMSSDKKNFLNDLPPRFANQYRYWQPESSEPKPEPQPNMFTPPPMARNWPNQEQQWWKPEPAYNQPIQPNYMPNYQFNPMYMQKEPVNPNYRPNLPIPTLQNLVASPNFNTSLSNFNYPPPQVKFDSAMFPQFNKSYPPMEAQNAFKGVVGDQQRHPQLNYQDGTPAKMQSEGPSSEVQAQGSTYSLFSGSQQHNWGQIQQPQHQHSLWSGPGPSALERLLEQQKQIKLNPSEPH